MRRFGHVLAALAIASVGAPIGSADAAGGAPSAAAPASAAPATTSAIPAADADSSAPKFLRVPVFFVTDRNKGENSTAQKPEFGTQRQYLSNCKHDYALGAAYITIQNTQGKQLSPTLQQIGWREDAEKSEAYRAGTLLAGPNHQALKGQFLDTFLSSAQKTQDHQGIMFVPGYMSTFDSGLISAARFAYYAERPVVLFSWASKGEFKAYSADEATIEWCQYHFNDLLRAFQAMSAKDPSFKLRIFAHSMGTRLPVRASDRFPGARFCNEVALVCPDVDDGLVSHYMGDVTVLKANEGAPTIRLYMSRKDKMLGLSQRVHGGYERTGKQKELDPKLMNEGQGEDLSAPLTDEEKAEASAESAEETEVAATAGGAGAPNLKQKAKDAPPTNLATVEDRFQMIDFTAIDTGKVGHKIPVEIITKVSATGEPGEGWKLVSEVPAAGTSATTLVSDPAKVGDPEAMRGEPEKKYFILISTVPPSKLPLKRLGRPHILPRRLKNGDWTLK